MTFSIRKFLLVYLIILFTFFTALIAAYYYYWDCQNPTKHAHHLIHILLLNLPLCGLLIWFIIDRGITPLDSIKQQIEKRAPHHLEPLNIKKIPHEIKSLVDALNSLFKRLKETMEREQRFAGDAAHELKTPLATIKAQAQIALNSDDIAVKNQCLEKLITSVNQSTHIIQQLLILSQLQPQQPPIDNPDNIALVSITREILAMMTPFALEKNIELALDSEDSLPMFKGHATAIGILVRNLVDNAIRYTQDGGHVFVKIYTTKNTLILEIKDNGPGIPKPLIPRVFERFFRVLGKKTPGSGLGLSIVKEIATLHHGRVVLISGSKGRGLVVRVFFPTT